MSVVSLAGNLKKTRYKKRVKEKKIDRLIYTPNEKPIGHYRPPWATKGESEGKGSIVLILQAHGKGGMRSTGYVLWSPWPSPKSFKCHQTLCPIAPVASLDRANRRFLVLWRITHTSRSKMGPDPIPPLRAELLRVPELRSVKKRVAGRVRARRNIGASPRVPGSLRYHRGLYAPRYSGRGWLRLECSRPLILD